MTTRPDPDQAISRQVADARAALAVIKASAQLLARHDWPLPDADRSWLLARLQAIDASVTRIVDDLAALQDAAGP